MASDFAEKLVERLVITDKLTAKLTKITIDIELLKVGQVLGHARYRNHEHNPGACSACRELERVVESLKNR